MSSSSKAAAKVAFAIFAVAIMTISVFVAATAPEPEPVADPVSPSPTYDSTITYYSNNGADDTLAVGYYGIPGTEYNPEVWEGTVSGAEGETNWAGPTYNPNVSEDLTLKLTFYNNTDNTYKILLPNGDGYTTTIREGSTSSNTSSFTAETGGTYFTFKGSDYLSYI